MLYEKVIHFIIRFLIYNRYLQPIFHTLQDIIYVTLKKLDENEIRFCQIDNSFKNQYEFIT